MTRLTHWIQNNHHLISNSAALVGTALFNSGLGFLYWWLAAQYYDQHAVGLASAVVSAMILLGSIAMLGFGTLLVGELPHRKGQELAFINTASVAILIASVMVSILFLVGMLTLTDNFDELVAYPAYFLMFVGGVALTALTLMIDQALVGLLQGGVQLRRNIAASVIKVALLVLFGLWVIDGDGFWIFSAWVVGMLASMILPARYLLNTYGRKARLEWGILREIGGSALIHHWLNLALDAPIRAMPVIVTVVLSPAVNASFYIAWMMGGLLFFPVQSLTLVLYAVGDGDNALLADKIRQTLRLSIVIGVVGYAVTFAVADFLMNLFGAEYARIATDALRIVAVAIFPLIIKDHYVAIHRIRKQTSHAARVITIGGIVEMIFATVGGIVGGVTLLSVLWVVAIALQAVYMTPTVLQAIRVSQPTGTDGVMG
jgi:O-antigen/teichoic acid export membrane protein